MLRLEGRLQERCLRLEPQTVNIIADVPNLLSPKTREPDVGTGFSNRRSDEDPPCITGAIGVQ